MKQLFGFTLAVVCVMSVACSKHSSGPTAGYGPNSLFPLKAGDTWYYNDSTFYSNASLKDFWLDTMTATSNVINFSGTGFTQLSETNGWFGGSYIWVNDNNTQIYEIDTPNLDQPYVLFYAVGQDQQVGYSEDAVDFPSCPLYEAQYAYAEPLTIGTYSNVYKNIDVYADCNNNILEQINTYVSPGIGVVRVEDYLTDTTGGNKAPYEDYSQTLTGTSLK